jgi:hypothetical protein
MLTMNLNVYCLKMKSFEAVTSKSLTVPFALNFFGCFLDSTNSNDLIHGPHIGSPTRHGLTSRLC